eukprot:3631296-Rhodomonas_salina.2
MKAAQTARSWSATPLGSSLPGRQVQTAFGCPTLAWRACNTRTPTVPGKRRPRRRRPCTRHR